MPNPNNSSGKIQLLRLRRDGARLEVSGEANDVKSALVRRQLQVEGQQPDQHQQRPSAQVKGDLVGGKILVVAPAPDADHDERGHQRQFVEKVKTDQVQRGERAEDAAGHEHEQNVEFLFARHDPPRNAGRGKGHDGPHDDQAQVDAIHPDVVAEADFGRPFMRLQNELETVPDQFDCQTGRT
jgi:hypothetical protein